MTIPGSSTSTAIAGKPAHFGRTPSEPLETPSVAFDDWLLQGERALLLSGAPGSGKSTVLRCLALDLVRTPELFPTVHDRLGARIPLLIPFALWSRLAAKEERDVGLAEVIRETFRAFVPQSELEDSFIEALFDERLVLLIDGLDEYSDEQAARTTLATIETFVRTHDVFTIATARPAGLRRLRPTSGFWKTARLVELQRRQQRDLATKLLSEDDSAATPVALRVEQFFQELEHSGRLQSLAAIRCCCTGCSRWRRARSSCRTRDSSCSRNSSRFSLRCIPTGERRRPPRGDHEAACSRPTTCGPTL